MRGRETGKTRRVSVNSHGRRGDGESYEPSTSADGRLVAFTSRASNLVRQDTNGKGDVLVHNMKTGRTKRVSVSSHAAQGNGFSGHASISADGRFVAFESVASNLVGGDTNGHADVFVLGPLR